jgi:hypothetical protein
MTPPSYLTTREFDTWREGHDAKVDRILDALERHDARNLDVEGRVTSLEVNQRNAGKLSARLSGAVGAIVAATITGVLHLLGGK